MISIIIPTKNEPGIQQLVNGINGVMEKQDHEIIVVDKSDVAPTLHGAVLMKQKGNGLGTAFLEGFEKSRGSEVVLMDGDGSHRPEDMLKLVDELKEHEMAVGSKFVKGGQTEDPFSRKFVSRGFSIITRLILWTGIRDPMTGFMATRREVIERTKLSPRGYKIVLELLYKSRANVKEVPIFFKQRTAGESEVGFNLRGTKEAFRIVWLMLRLRWGRMRGRW